MERLPIKPRDPFKTQYGIDPKLVGKRAYELPNITSVLIRELFPDAPPTLFPSEKGIGLIRKETEKSLANVDMSMIKATDTVDILAYHHGFTLMGGEPYAEMIRTIRDVVKEKTGANVRLKVGSGVRFREPEEYIKIFKLDEYFEKKAFGVAGIDQGVVIETEIGPLYVLKRMFDANWFIHAMHSDPREIHFHRQLDRAFKPFGMAYARVETRSAYHQNLGPRACNFVARAIFESDFIRKKYAFTSCLVMSPSGIVAIDADNDIYGLNDRVDLQTLKHYGKTICLFRAIDECIAVMDAPCPVSYVFAAGTIFSNLFNANLDVFDLDNPLPPYTFYTEVFYDEHGKPFNKVVPPINPALKCVVNNYSLGGYPGEFFSKAIPTIVVGKEQAEFFYRDSLMQAYMERALVAESLDAAMDFAYKITGTDKVIIFDNATGGINVSESLAKLLTDKAPEISRMVEKEFYPKWLRQRGITEDILKNRKLAAA